MRLRHAPLELPRRDTLIKILVFVEDKSIPPPALVHNTLAALATHIADARDSSAVHAGLEARDLMGSKAESVGRGAPTTALEVGGGIEALVLADHAIVRRRRGGAVSGGEAGVDTAFCEPAVTLVVSARDLSGGALASARKGEATGTSIDATAAVDEHGKLVGNCCDACKLGGDLCNEIDVDEV